MAREGDENAQNDTHIFRLKLEVEPNLIVFCLFSIFPLIDRAAAFSGCAALELACFASFLMSEHSGTVVS